MNLGACHLPPADPSIWSHVLREEQRVVLARRRHRLAERAELHVEEVLDETFIGLHPAVDREWAGFWSLDDHRGEPPHRLTADHASNPQEVLAAIAAREAISTAPATVATALFRGLGDVTAIPLRGAQPCSIAIVGHADRRNALVTELLTFILGAAQRSAPPPLWRSA